MDKLFFFVVVVLCVFCFIYYYFQTKFLFLCITHDPFQWIKCTVIYSLTWPQAKQQEQKISQPYKNDCKLSAIKRFNNIWDVFSVGGFFCFVLFSVLSLRVCFNITDFTLEKNYRFYSWFITHLLCNSMVIRNSPWRFETSWVRLQIVKINGSYFFLFQTSIYFL